MNCLICQDLLQQRLDGLETAETPELERHLADCPHCAALHAASSRLSAALCRLTPPRPPSDLTGRILAAVLNDRQAERKRRRRRLAVSALAASLLLCATAIGFYRFDVFKFGQTVSQPIAVDQHLPPDNHEPLAPATASVRDTVTEAGNALAALTTRTADETVGQSRLLVPLVTGPSLDELDMPLALEPTMSYFEAGQGVTVALEPVTNSARRAVDLFRRDLPHVESAPKP
jgi:hypothetical protein